MKMLLTAKAVETVKPTGKKFNISDTVSPNLNLRVTTAGKKNWIWRGRVNGKLTEITLGRIGLHSLQDARKWADSISVRRDLGDDLEADTRKGKAARAAQVKFVLDDLFELYQEHGSAGARWKKNRHYLYNSAIKPLIGKKLVASLDHDDLMAVIRDAHSQSVSNGIKVKHILGGMFRWATRHGRDLTKLKVNPALELVVLGENKSRERFLTVREIRIVMKYLDESNFIMARPTLLLLYTGLRRSEVFEARWSEIDFDTGVWSIPSSRSKNGMSLDVPLPDVALKLDGSKNSGV